MGDGSKTATVDLTKIEFTQIPATTETTSAETS